MTLLVIGAHPDDEISAGGTIVKHSRAGDRVVILTMTRGGMGHRTMPVDELTALREKEAQAASEVLGAELRMLNYPDGGVPQNRDVALELAGHIREVQPDIVLTHSLESMHPDHNATHQDAVDAVFLASLPLLDLGRPDHVVRQVLLFAHDLYRRHDVYVNIQDTMDAKIQAAGCHASQYTDWLVKGGSAADGGWDQDYRDAFRMEGHLFGGHCGVEYAEAFDYYRKPDPVALDLLSLD